MFFNISESTVEIKDVLYMLYFLDTYNISISENKIVFSQYTLQKE